MRYRRRVFFSTTPVTSPGAPAEERATPRAVSSAILVAPRTTPLRPSSSTASITARPTPDATFLPLAGPILPTAVSPASATSGPDCWWTTLARRSAPGHSRSTASPDAATATAADLTAGLARHKDDRKSYSRVVKNYLFPTFLKISTPLRRQIEDATRDVLRAIEPLLHPAELIDELVVKDLPPRAAEYPAELGALVLRFLTLLRESYKAPPSRRRLDSRRGGGPHDDDKYNGSGATSGKSRKPRHGRRGISGLSGRGNGGLSGRGNAGSSGRGNADSSRRGAHSDSSGSGTTHNTTKRPTAWCDSEDKSVASSNAGDFPPSGDAQVSRCISPSVCTRCSA